MKILFFSPYFYPYTSGITTYPQKIFNHLAKKNQIKILTFRYDEKLKKTEKFDGCQIIRMDYWFKISKGFLSPQSLIPFFKEAKKADLILLNIPNSEGLPLAILAKILRRPFISIFHCQVFLEKSFFNRVVNCFLNFSIFVQLLLSNNVIAYTKDYFKSLDISRFFLKKTRFILPPVDLLKINQKKLNDLVNLKRNKIWIGYAGRIASEKGLEYLIQSLTPAGWSNGLPAGEIELVFAGPYGKDVAGENKYFQKIITLLKENKIKYRFFGNLSGGDLSAFYKTIDILTLPSINQTEAFGMVQVEAMLLGTPAIASNLPGVRVPIRLTKMGILVEPKNSQQISEAIIKILKNKNKFSNEFLINKAKKIFNIKKTYHFYDKTINLY